MNTKIEKGYKKVALGSLEPTCLLAMTWIRAGPHLAVTDGKTRPAPEWRLLPEPTSGTVTPEEGKAKVKVLGGPWPTRLEVWL